MTQDIKEWLAGLGLGKYAETFSENDIDFRSLPKLSEQDLKDIGVSLGHRRVLQDAIATLGEQPPVEPLGQRPPESHVGAGLSGEAERRQLTVMFCDLVGSTELSQKLDPEDLREVNRAYQDACKAAIERYDGYVARYMGDGVLAYFGYPQAHEDDAERAIHAGLGVVESIAALGPELQNLELGVRIGIATGPVVVGDLIGRNASQESTVVGETPNLAARLQGLADKDTVVVGPGTHDLAGARFEYDDLGSHSLKGIRQPVTAWKVRSAAAVESRFDATRHTGLTPLVGREHEVGLLLDRWRQAHEGEGQVVLLSGEPGIGKSRITETLQDRITADDAFRLRYQCSPYYTNSALHPVIERLERAANFEHDDSNERKLNKLGSMLEIGGIAPELTVTLIGALLSIPTDDQYPSLHLSPEQQKEATLEALVAQMEALSRRHPVLVAFEDAHWADPTSLELLELTIARARDLPVMIVVTFRPEFSPPWTGYAHITSLTLNRLTRSLALKMVLEVTKGRPLPNEVQSKIVEKADGVPLFAEELTKAILESRLLKQESDRLVLSGSMAELAIPATLTDSLMARLDRLGEAKEIAQAAAVIGREFDEKLLGAIFSNSTQLSRALSELVTAGLIFVTSRTDGQRFSFKHALVQEAAYESLLRSRRRELHGRIAKALTSDHPQVPEIQLEMIAHHLTEAGLIDDAIQYWWRAGDQAVEQCAYIEAVANLDRALELITEIDDERIRAQTEIKIRISMHTPMVGLDGPRSERVTYNNIRALAVCEEFGDAQQLFSVLWSAWQRLSLKASRESQQVADRLVELSRQLDDAAFELESHHCQWGSLFFLGNVSAILEHTRIGLEIYEPQVHHALTHTYAGHDPGVCAHLVRGIALWLGGFANEAETSIKNGFTLAQELDHRTTWGLALLVGMYLAAAQREKDLLARRTHQFFDFVREDEYPDWQILGRGAEACIAYSLGRAGCDSAPLLTSMDACLTGENLMTSAPVLSLAAGELGRKGELHRGLDLVERTLTHVQQGDTRWFEADLHRLKGELLYQLLGTDSDEVELSLHKAVNVSQAQGPRSLQLRALMSLARLRMAQGKHGDARELLSPMHSWFSEGNDTSDLREAKALWDKFS